MTTDTTATLARMDAARIGPHITCPVSRHAAMMAEAMMRGEPYVMMDEDRAHCGASIGDTVASLWEARAEIKRLREALKAAEAHADRQADALHHMVNAALHPDQMADEALAEYEAWRAPKIHTCISEGCTGRGVIMFERGGVGSRYCADCYARIDMEGLE